MNKYLRIAFGLVLVLATGGQAHALTFQDKQDKNITDDGQSRVIETGTRLNETAEDSSLGPSTLTCGTVPTDKNWHVTAVSYTYNGTITNVRVALLANGKTVDQDGAPTDDEAQVFNSDFWLDEGETVALEVVGYTAAEGITCRVFGLEYPDAGS